VQLAAATLFRFRYRGTNAAVLWSEAEHVWLGRETFLSWALRDPTIDIPWIVAEAADAPDDKNELLAAVRTRLEAYWKKRVASLPRTSNPRWLPLP
jgi:hypothetical protein